MRNAGAMEPITPPALLRPLAMLLLGMTMALLLAPGLLAVLRFTGVVTP